MLVLFYEPTSIRWLPQSSCFHIPLLPCAFTVTVLSDKYKDYLFFLVFFLFNEFGKYYNGFTQCSVTHFCDHVVPFFREGDVSC